VLFQVTIVTVLHPASGGAASDTDGDSDGDGDGPAPTPCLEPRLTSRILTLNPGILEFSAASQKAATMLPESPGKLLGSLRPASKRTRVRIWRWPLENEHFLALKSAPFWLF